MWKDDVIKTKNNNTNNDLSLNQQQISSKKIIFLNKLKSKKKDSLKSSLISSQFRKSKTYEYNHALAVQKTSKGLDFILGLIGVKYDAEQIKTNYYKPWEMMTIKCSKALKFSENKQQRKDIINLTQHCLIRVYPEKFNSSNYNIIKCFSCGIQSCCLNIQATMDDYTLYNKIFFKQNERLGYVLKPEKFLNPNVNWDYSKPEYLFKVEILSLINLSKLIEEAQLDINNAQFLILSIYSIGVEEDEKNPPKNFNLINGSMFPGFKNGNPKVEFKIYEYELSALIIKIKYGKEVIGRSCIPYSLMKQGIRRIPIYDSSCFNMKDVYMVGHFDYYKI